MQATEFEDAKLLWKVFYASHCFRQAREAAQHIFDNKLEKEAPLFHPLIVAIYTLYAKPFTRSDGVGRLEETFVPNQHLQEHRIMLQHRHEIYAHRDADGFPIADFGAVNQVRVVRTAEFMGLVATDFHARYTAMPPIINLCRTLEQKADATVKELWDRHKGKIPNTIGECLLNVLDSNADLWLSQKPMILSSHNKPKTKKVSEIICRPYGFRVTIPGGQWEGPTEPSHQDIKEAIKNNELEIRGFQSHYAELEEEWNANLTGDFNAKCMEYARRSKTYHARRIVFFVVKGWDGDPIVLEPDGVNVNDGLHRLKAAKHKDLKEVEVRIAGET